MAEPIRARDLIRRAQALYDGPDSALPRSATAAWHTAFASGGRWMRQALEALRGKPLPGTQFSLNALGLVKYGLASAAALMCVALAFLLAQPLAVLLAVPAFYAVEAQMVFLMPLALEGSPRPFRDSLLWTGYAGGTLAVMRTVLPLAATMLFGGLVGRGFVRSWCLGCLAVCIWYEDLRVRREACPAGTLSGQPG